MRQGSVPIGPNAHYDPISGTHAGADACAYASPDPRPDICTHDRADGCAYASPDPRPNFSSDIRTHGRTDEHHSVCDMCRHGWLDEREWLFLHLLCHSLVCRWSSHFWL